MTNTYSGNILINGPMTGNLSFGNHLSGFVTINGDYTGLFNVAHDLGGHIQINGTLWNGPLGTGRLHIRDHMLEGSSVTCQNLDLRDTGENARWMVVGNNWGDSAVAGQVHEGTINVTGTLSGRIKINGRSSLAINVGTLNAPGFNANWGPDGIESEAGFNSRDIEGAEQHAESKITIGTFTAGHVGLSYGLAPVGQLPDTLLEFAGTISVTGAMGSNAKIDTRNPDPDPDVTERQVDMRAQIMVGGNMKGRIEGNKNLVGGAVAEDAYIAGRIGFLSTFSTPGIVVISSALQSGAAVVVDYDGGNSGVNWGSGAEVQVGAVTYTYGRHPPIYVFEITDCKADMDNNGTVNPFDINPFVTALSDPAAYDASFPGLEGGRVWHGDLNCDGTLNPFDIDPFLARMAEVPRCCEPTCGSCQGFFMGGEAELTPEYVAELYEAYVSPSLQPIFETLAAGLAEYYGESSQGEFWTDVLTLIE